MAIGILPIGFRKKSEARLYPRAFLQKTDSIGPAPAPPQ